MNIKTLEAVIRYLIQGMNNFNEALELALMVCQDRAEEEHYLQEGRDENE